MTEGAGKRETSTKGSLEGISVLPKGIMSSLSNGVNTTCKQDFLWLSQLIRIVKKRTDVWNEVRGSGNSDRNNHCTFEVDSAEEHGIKLCLKREELADIKGLWT